MPRVKFDLPAAEYILMSEYNKLKITSNRRKELLKEGLEVTKRADGHWSDLVQWMQWTDKVEEELGDG